MPSKLRKPLKWLIGGAAALVMLAALLAVAFSVVVTRVPEYRVQVQDWIKERSGLAVEFRTLSARWRLYGPELVFDQAVVRTPDRTRILATATRGSVGFDLWRAIREGRLTAGRFSLESPQIGLIRTREGRIQLLGQGALPERSEASAFAIEQLPTGRFEVEDAVVTFRDEITGRGPWSLSGVNFELTRSATELRLVGGASLPPALGRELEFTATADGPLEEYQTLVSTFSFAGEELDFAGWADVFPDEWPAPETGQGGVRVQGALQGSTLIELSAAVDLRNVAAAAPAWTIPLPTAAPMQQPRGRNPSGDNGPIENEESPFPAAAEPVARTPSNAASALPEMVSYERVAFTLQARRDQEQWSAALTDVELTREDAPWRAAEIRARWSRDASGVLRASGGADRIVLENVWPLLAYLPESENLARLRALNVRGTVEDLTLSFAAPAPHDARSDTDSAAARSTKYTSAKYDLSARIDDLAFDPILRAPGLAGLSGELQATQQGGQWRLAENQVSFDLPRLFKAPLSVDLSDGAEISWRRQEHAGPEGEGPDAGWIVTGERLALANEDGRAAGRFSARIPADGGSPVLEASAQAADLRVSSTAKYIPVGRLSARTVQWFEQAFVDGRVTTADLLYKGPTRSFPFRNDEGEFRARAHVEGAVFSYQPGWTPAREAVADVEFHNEGMHIRSSGATVGQVRIASATADIADLKKTELIVKAAAHGDLSGGLRFLKRSPLGPKLGEQFARLDGTGPLRADLSLYLPIRRMADRDIEVTARFEDASASLRGLAAPVTNLSGALTVRNTLPSAADLHGRWLGGPVSVSIVADGLAAAELTAQGRAAAAQFAPLLSEALSSRLSGAADWRLTTRLAAAAAGADSQSVVRIESDTQGLGVSLPAPLGKNEDEARPLQVALEFDGDASLLARGSFGDVRSLVRLRRLANRWSLDRGGVRADGIAASLPDHRGLRLEGTIDRLVLDEWLALRGEGGGRPLSDYLQAANVRVREFGLFGYRWPDVRGVLQATEAGWRVDVSGAHAQGQILIPADLRGEQPLRATMDRLVLEKDPQRRTDRREIDPRNLPALQVYVSDLRVDERTIGAVDLKASRAPQGVRFDSATVMSGSLRAEARGHWFITTDGPRSSLDATIVSDDVAAALEALDYTGFLEAEHGEIRADLTWPGGFNGSILEHASGAISVHAEAGRLVNLQPGAGRVLGLFSVAALPRRLALDFSDLTDKGLAFDAIHGDFELRDGNAYTSNLLLRGPAAEIGIAGRTGLASRDYDQTAVVTGNLGASLPVAGALAGGPAVGAALLVFSQMFKEPLKGITRGYYRITGPWDDPNVERIDKPEQGGTGDS